MNEPQLLTFQGEPALGSREVAKMIGKRHAHLMRDIRCYINDMEEAGKKLLVQNKNRMMNFLNNSSSGFYVHRKSFLI